MNKKEVSQNILGGGGVWALKLAGLRYGKEIKGEQVILQSICL